MAFGCSGGHTRLKFIAPDTHSVLAQALARLAFEVIQKAAAMSERERQMLIRATLREHLAINAFFDLASDLGVGEVAVDFTEVLALVDADLQTLVYLELNLFEGSVEVRDRDQVLAMNPLGYVGVAIIPVRSLPWIYWNPPSSPAFDPRLFHMR